MKPGQLWKGEKISLFREGKEEGAFREKGFGCMMVLWHNDNVHTLSDKSVPGSRLPWQVYQIMEISYQIIQHTCGNGDGMEAAQIFALII